MNAVDQQKYQDVVDALVRRGVMPERTPGIESTQQGLKDMGFFRWPFFQRLQQDPRRIIVVAGTNGKGSVCATLEALFKSTGERVGLYTSPHLVEHTERIRLDGQDISPQNFVRAYEAVTALTSIKLSHFEALTLMAVWAFCSGEMGPPVDRVILEVGLGGIWDSTNAVPHGLAVIAKLGFDHQNFLGNTIGEIARNKFGIVHPKSEFLKQGMTVVHASLPEDVKQIAFDWQVKTQSHWHETPVHPYLVSPDSVDSGSPRFLIDTPWGQAPLVLPGQRGAENTSLALKVFELCGYEPAPFLPSLANVRWPGRMEKVYLSALERTVYFSGDHNPQGVGSLLELLQHYPRRHLHLLLGVGLDKDLQGMMVQIQGLKNTSYYFTETPFKGLTLKEYGPWSAGAAGGWSDPYEALTNVCKSAQPDDMIVVTGSLYLVGAIIKNEGQHQKQSYLTQDHHEETSPGQCE